MNRSVARTLALAPAAAAPFVAVSLFDPNVAGNYPSCPVRALLGVDCPGCGSLRALHDLAHLDLVAAMDHNLMLLLVLPLVAVEAARWVRGRPPSILVRARYAPLAVLVAFTVWVLVRNIPLAPFAVLASAAV